MLTYDTPALRQTGSRNLVTKYQIPVINSCLEKCAYMFNVYKNQQSRQTGSRNLMGPKTLPIIQNQKVLFKVGTFYNNQHKLSRAFQTDMHNKLHKLNTAQ
jgi:hypothetical protein